MTSEAWNPERALVSSLLANGDPAAIAVAAEEVSSADFALEACALTFDAILALDAAGRRVDLVTVAEALKVQGQLATVGGPSFLGELVAAPSLDNALEYARLIRDAGARRQLRRASLEVADLSRSDAMELPALLEEAGRKFNEVLLQRQRSAFRPMSELVEETLTMLDAMKHDGGLLGLGTGFPDVDRVLAGMQAGELIVLAARPGVGKTSWAMQVAEHHACGEKRLPVAVFSLEMPSKQLVLRMAAARARVALERIRRGRLSPADEERLTDAMQALFDAPIHIDDSGDLSPFDLRAKARRLKQQHPALGLIIIDYLQLMKVRGRVESRQVEVAEISRSLKQLAKELELPILALAQLNRRVEERKGPPMLSDLRESGAIEQDADVVMFLHRERADDEDDEKKSAAELAAVEVHIAKQRNGPQGEARLLFQGAYTRFESKSY